MLYVTLLFTILSTNLVAQERNLTLDLIIKKAITDSDSYQEIEALKSSVEFPLKLREAPLQGEFFMKSSLLNKDGDPYLSFAPYKEKSQINTIGVSKFFQSGTALKASFLDQTTKQNFSGARETILDYNSTAFEFSISQSLLKDAFGKATRASVKAGENEKSLRELRIKSLKEDWFFIIAQKFYDAWFLQVKLKESLNSLKRRERLLTVAKIKKNRGTIEKADLLQIEGAVEKNGIEVRNNRLALQSVWEELINVAKLPTPYKLIDPLAIPIVLSGRDEIAFDECKKPKEMESNRIDEVRQNVALYENELTKNNSLALPDLKLSLTTSRSGIDSERGTAFSETLNQKYPSTTVAFEFSMPLDRSTLTATRDESLAQLMRNRAQLDRLKTDEEHDFNVSCNNLNLFIQNRDYYQTIVKKFEERAIEEQKRYDLGRGTIFTVIGAEDDLSNVIITSKENEHKIRMTSWKILKLLGGIYDHIDDLATSYDYAKDN